MVTVDSSQLLGARQGGETPSHIDPNTSTSLPGLQLGAGLTFLPMLVWQLSIFNSEAVEEDGGLFNTIVTAFRHRMTRRLFGLQWASVEPSGTGLARIVIGSLTWIYVFSSFSYPTSTLGTGKR